MGNTELLAVLLSWAVSLSGYSNPETMPEIQYESNKFFQGQACNNVKKCQVVAWYNDKGIIFLNEKLNRLEDPIVRSVIVHELTHYLQDLSGKFNELSCENHAAREREAYSIQRTYLNRIAGRFAATYPVYAPCPAS